MNPALPQTIEDFHAAIQDSQYFHINGQSFYRGMVESEGSHKACIFIFENVLIHFREAHQIFFDGTFKTTPRLFYQNFVVFFKYLGHVLPGAFILMSSKSQDLYLAVFQKLRNLGIAPVQIMSDWELASRNSASVVWPTATINGCFFHYTSAVQKKLRKLGLAGEFEVPRSRKTIQQILCLPLLP